MCSELLAQIVISLDILLQLIPLTQVETVLTTPNDALIGNPTTVSANPIVETPLITPTELAAVDVISNLS